MPEEFAVSQYFTPEELPTSTPPPPSRILLGPKDGTVVAPFRSSGSLVASGRDIFPPASSEIM